MKVRILGTAAAEAIPALWCECEWCRKARQLGGKEVRRRTAYWIDGDTLVDFGPDIAWQAHEFAIDLSEIRRILITHSHEDHLSPVELFWRRRGYSQVTRPLKLFGNRRVLNTIVAHLLYYADNCDTGPLQTALEEVKPGETRSDGDLQFLALHANHAHHREEALNYVLTRGGKSLLLANDTGIWQEEVWEKIRGIRLDGAVIECTTAMRFPENRHHHLGINGTLEFRDRLSALGCIDGTTQIWTAHFSHNGHALHRDLVDFFEPRGIKVAYDGVGFEL